MWAISRERDEGVWMDLGPDSEHGSKQIEMAILVESLKCVSQHEED